MPAATEHSATFSSPTKTLPNSRPLAASILYSTRNTHALPITMRRRNSFDENAKGSSIVEPSRRPSFGVTSDASDSRFSGGGAFPLDGAAMTTVSPDSTSLTVPLSHCAPVMLFLFSVFDQNPNVEKIRRRKESPAVRVFDELISWACLRVRPQID